MKDVATIILNRNLPQITDDLYECILRNNSDLTDIYIVESGSDENKLSKYCSWWANWPEAVNNGLRFPRGFNYGLYKLWENKIFFNYKYYFFVPNDSEFENKSFLHILLEEMSRHTRVAILSPCSASWGESKLLNHNETKYFWYINHIAWLVRREFIEDVMPKQDLTYLNFLYDGNNFRGYFSDLEVSIKGYSNDWASAITNKVWAEENESHLLTKADLIKTETYDNNLKKLFKEGCEWIHSKYGFKSRWRMLMYAKFLYEQFFTFYPEFEKFKI